MNLKKMVSGFILSLLMFKMSVSSILCGAMLVPDCTQGWWKEADLPLPVEWVPFSEFQTEPPCSAGFPVMHSSADSRSSQIKPALTSAALALIQCTGKLFLMACCQAGPLALSAGLVFRFACSDFFLKVPLYTWSRVNLQQRQCEGCYMSASNHGNTNRL